MSDNDNPLHRIPMPTTFTAEFLEVWEDLPLDLRETFFDVDEDIGRRLNAFVNELFRLANGNPGMVITNLMSGMLWVFFAGREHALRGYAAPVPKQDSGVGWVPDTVADLFRTDQDEA